MVRRRDDDLDSTPVPKKCKVAFNSKLFITCSKFLIALEIFNGVRLFYRWQRVLLQSPR